MPKFTILSRETVYYETEIEAEDEDKARAIFLDMEHTEETLTPFGADYFEIYDIEENANA